MLYWLIFLTQYAALMQSKLEKKKNHHTVLQPLQWSLEDGVTTFSLGSALS